MPNRYEEGPMSSDFELRLSSLSGTEFREFDDLLAESDFISVHVALTPETRHLFSTGSSRRSPK